jgi:hypothetical protein
MRRCKMKISEDKILEENKEAMVEKDEVSEEENSEIKWPGKLTKNPQPSISQHSHETD